MNNIEETIKNDQKFILQVIRKLVSSLLAILDNNWQKQTIMRKTQVTWVNDEL